jgi:NADPH:quinone reductase-like Zn-dependent oxidoreductase
MRAIVTDDYGSVDVLRLEDVDQPVPRPHELLVRVHAASVNAADGLLMRGLPYLMRSQIGWRRPRIKGLGLDFAGVVEAVGEAATSFRPGDAVFGELAPDHAGATRAFAEYVCVAAASVVRKPANVSFSEAAAVPLAGCAALYAVRDYGQVGPGQQVLINGAGGGVGIYAVQLAKHFGATVTGVCSDRKAARVRDVGADRVIDYRRHDFTTDPERYDVIVDIVSSQGVRRCRRVLAPRGRFVWVGGPAANRWLGPLRNALNVSLMSLASRRQRWLCVTKSSSPQDVAVLAGLLADGSLRPVIDRCYPLDRVAEAIRYLEGGHACGKVVIEI